MDRLIVSAFLACAVAMGGVAQAAAPPAAVAQALADTARPVEDRDADQRRAAAELLTFANVRPGQRVADLVPGHGYFTRLLSLVVGTKGRVYAVVPPRRLPSEPAPVDDLKGITTNTRFANVQILEQRVQEFELPERVDVIWTSLVYHEFHHLPQTDVSAINKRLYDALKPGGTLVVIDHAAQPGSGTRDVSTRHRIDEQLVREEILAAGFEFVGDSRALANKSDTRELPVFDDRIRGRTDQFVLLFRRPAAR